MHQRRWIDLPIFPYLLVLVWALIQWRVRPPTVVADWMAWRQADTMAIARNFVERPSGLLYPRVDWGGDGPGYVESELQLVPYVISRAMVWLGVVEWPAQLLSLVCTIVAGLGLETLLRRRYGAGPALVALAAWLGGRGVVFSSTAVQPDLASLAFSVFALIAFLDYCDSGRLGALVASAVLTAIATAIKPTALQLGVVQFVLLAISRRDLLLRKATWLAWLGVLVALAAVLWHARRLYVVFGNTFGILSGGDRKTPRLEMLAHPRLYLETALVSLGWGVGWVGGAAGLWLLVRARWSSLEVALFAGIAVLSVMALRYMSQAEYGAHYHLPATMLGAVFVAHAAAEVPTSTRHLWPRLAWALGLVGLWANALHDHCATIVEAAMDDTVVMGRALKQRLAAGDLVAVRSNTTAWARFWRVPNNYQDPRIFYVAHTRGWAIPSDSDAAGELEDLVTRGARWYVEYGAPVERPVLARYLARHATLVHADSQGQGRIWRMASVTPEVPAGASSAVAAAR